jgi:hypothetical protein
MHLSHDEIVTLKVYRLAAWSASIFNKRIRYLVSY